MYQDLDLVTTVRKSRLKWLGHVHRMSSQRGPKMELEGNPRRRRKKGRPRKRWLDDVQDDMIQMGVKRWRTKAMVRIKCRKICEAARFFKNCRATEKKKKKKRIILIYFIPKKISFLLHEIVF
jgi:hypothetical protein